MPDTSGSAQPNEPVRVTSALEQMKDWMSGKEPRVRATGLSFSVSEPR
jgi:hypothetical protein